MVAAMLPKTETHRILRPTKKKKKTIYVCVQENKKKIDRLPRLCQIRKNAVWFIRPIPTYIFYYILLCSVLYLYGFPMYEQHENEILGVSVDSTFWRIIYCPGRPDGRLPNESRNT